MNVITNGSTPTTDRLSESGILKSSLGRRFELGSKPLRSLNDLQVSLINDIRSKESEGFYRFEYHDCVLCGSNRFEYLATHDRYGLYLPVAICRNCGLIQVTPRMTSSAYTSFYQSEYRGLYEGKNANAISAFEDEVSRGTLICKFLRSSGAIDRPISDLAVLEVGCGAGGVLKVFSDQGCQVFGTDINPKYLDFGKRTHRLPLACGHLSGLDIPFAPDIIIYSHVLEHILNPHEELRHARELLKNDGIIYIETPGVFFLRRGTYDFMQIIQNAHVFYFTLRSLRNLLEQNGYIFVFGNEFIRSVFRKSSSKNAFEHQPLSMYSQTTRFLKRVERERLFLPFAPFPLLRKARRFLNNLCYFK